MNRRDQVSSVWARRWLSRREISSWISLVMSRSKARRGALSYSVLKILQARDFRADIEPPRYARPPSHIV